MRGMGIFLKYAKKTLAENLQGFALVKKGGFFKNLPPPPPLPPRGRGYMWRVLRGLLPPSPLSLRDVSPPRGEQPSTRQRAMPFASIWFFRKTETLAENL